MTETEQNRVKPFSGHASRHRRALATGAGCVCAAGNSLRETLASLYAGSRSPQPPVRIRADLGTKYPVFEIPSDFVGELKALSESSDFGAVDLNRKPSRTNAMASLAAVEAARNAGLDLAALRSMRVGIAIGTTVGCTLNNEPFYRAWRSGDFPSLDAIDAYLANNPAQYLARALGLDGPVATLANACSSGTDAIGLAKSWIETGRCDAALAGGADELSRVTYLGFVSLMIVSSHPCRPFDRRRDGLNLGEGAGMLFLESVSSAEKRGAEAIARIAGYACFADAHHPTAPHPQGRGLRRAVEAALAEAQVLPRDVDFINAHGTATPDNDRVEGRTLAALFHSDIPVVATKAYTGHTLGAAGGIEAALAVGALRDQRLPATVGFEEPDPECIATPTAQSMELEARTAISDSLAFGGGNSVLVFRKG